MSLRSCRLRGVSVLACGLTIAGVLAGCGPEPLNTSQGSFGKTDTTTSLPPQPDPAAVARQRAAAGGKPTEGTPNTGSGAPAVPPGNSQ